MYTGHLPSHMSCKRHLQWVGTAERRRPHSVIALAAAKGFAGQTKRETKQDTKKGKGKPRLEARQQTQQQRSVEERYMEKAEARATGELPPDEAFEKRLEAMRRRAAAATKDKPAGGQGSLSILDAAPAFSDDAQGVLGPSQRSSMAASSSADAEEGGSFGPGKVLLGGGAIVLAAIFVVTSFSDFAPQSRPAPVSQERKLGDEERRDLQNQASALEKELQGGSADAATLKRAAATYSALGEGTKAAGALERLTEAQPDNPEGWQLLAEARMALGDAKRAVPAYKRAVAEADSPDLALLQGMADALVSDARPKEAIELLAAQQRGLKPGSEAGIDPTDLQLLIGKVYTQWPRHDADALTVYDKIVEEHPEDFRGHAAKGVLLRKLGRKGDAQRAFLQARYNAPRELQPLVDKIIAP